MKRTIILLVVLLCCFTGFAEETPQTKERRHSIEITTGLPSYPVLIKSLLSSLDSYDEKDKDYGQKLHYHLPCGLNLGYAYSFGKRWEVQALANVVMTISDVRQYPVMPEDPETGKVHIDLDPEPSVVDRDVLLDYSFSVACRYKWIVREKFSMYSSLGFGFIH